jgi:hypothetical protein
MREASIGRHEGATRYVSGGRHGGAGASGSPVEVAAACGSLTEETPEEARLADGGSQGMEAQLASGVARQWMKPMEEAHLADEGSQRTEAQLAGGVARRWRKPAKEGGIARAKARESDTDAMREYPLVLRFNSNSRFHATQTACIRRYQYQYQF